MDLAAHVFTLGMPNRVMRSKSLAYSDESFPFVAHQMRLRFDLFFEDSFSLVDREIVHHPGAGIACRRADSDSARSLHNRQYGSLCGPPLALVTAPRRRGIGFVGS
jgi:hypothetical protein